MKIVVKKAGQMPEVREVENDLDVFREIVGGHIECVRVSGNILCVCNEEGKLLNLPVNLFLHGDMVCGDVFFCTAGAYDFEGLSDKDVEFLMNAMQILKLKF